jgi:hypothetical protein
MTKTISPLGGHGKQAMVGTSFLTKIALEQNSVLGHLEEHGKDGRGNNGSKRSGERAGRTSNTTLVDSLRSRTLGKDGGSSALGSSEANLSGSGSGLLLVVKSRNSAAIESEGLVLDSTLLGTTECGLLKLNTDNGLDGELDIGININTRERERDDVNIKEGKVDTLSGGKVVKGRDGASGLSVQQVARGSGIGRVDSDLLDPRALDGSLIRGDIGTEVGALGSTSVLEQEGRLGDRAGNVTEDTESTLGTNVNLNLSAEVLRLELDIDGGRSGGIAGITERAVVGITAASDSERVAVATVQIADVGKRQHKVTKELVANGVGVTGSGRGEAVNVEGTLRSGLGILVVDCVTSTSCLILKSPAGKSEGPLERSSQDDTTIRSVVTVVIGEHDLLSNDSGLEVDIGEHGDVGGDGDSLGEGDLDGDDMLQVALNSGTTETRQLLSVLNSDHGTISGETRLDIVVQVPTALESSTPRDGSSVGLNAGKGIVGRSEGGRSRFDLLVPEVARVAATRLSGVGSIGGVAQEHLGAGTVLDEGRLNVKDQTVVLITVGLDAIGVPSNQGREVGGEVLRSTKVDILALRVGSSVLGAVSTEHTGVAIAETSGTTDAKASILVQEAISASAEAAGGLGGRLGADGISNDASASTLAGRRGAARTNLDNAGLRNGTRRGRGQANLQDGSRWKVSGEASSGDRDASERATNESNTGRSRVGSGRKSALNSTKNKIRTSQDRFRMLIRCVPKCWTQTKSWEQQRRRNQRSNPFQREPERSKWEAQW